jgi:hypothetical protein
VMQANKPLPVSSLSYVIPNPLDKFASHQNLQANVSNEPFTCNENVCTSGSQVP